MTDRTSVRNGDTGCAGEAPSRVTTYHLDEYIDLPETHPASFRRYLRERFLAHVSQTGEIMRGRRVVLSVSGDRKAAVVGPASILRQHPNAHLFLDPPAATHL